MKYTVKVSWKKKSDEPFIDGKYSRGHAWVFDGGAELRASSSPQVVPVPWSDASAADPEEAFVASLSSCHMLFFLSIAASRQCVIEAYEDCPEGVMGKNEQGKMAMTTVTLKPRVVFSGGAYPVRRPDN